MYIITSQTWSFESISSSPSFRTSFGPTSPNVETVNRVCIFRPSWGPCRRGGSGRTGCWRPDPIDWTRTGGSSRGCRTCAAPAAPCAGRTWCRAAPATSRPPNSRAGPATCRRRCAWGWRARPAAVRWWTWSTSAAGWWGSWRALRWWSTAGSCCAPARPPIATSVWRLTRLRPSPFKPRPLPQASNNETFHNRWNEDGRTISASRTVSSRSWQK